MKTNRFYLYFLLFALVAAATVSSCSDDDLWRTNDNGAQLTEEGDFRLSTFPLYEDLWDIPYSVQSFDIVLLSHTDDSELRFEAECDHQYGGMNYITIRIPRDQLIPDSDYDMQGYLKNGDILNKRLTVTFRNEMLSDIIHTAIACNLSGRGTKDEPYQIGSANDFTTFLISLAEDDTKCKGIYFKQTKHIKLPAMSTEPVSRFYRGEAFAGHYDGGGHEVNITFTGKGTDAEDDYAGMFTRLLDGATIDNLTIYAAMSGLRSKGGALAGSASGHVTISNVNLTGSITNSKSEIGGLIGLVEKGTLQVTNVTFANPNPETVEDGFKLLGTQKLGTIVGNAINSTIHINTVSNVNAKGDEEEDDYQVVEIIGSGSKVGGLIGNAENCTFNIQNIDMEWGVVKSAETIQMIYGKSGVGGLIGEALINGTSTIANCMITYPVRAEGDHVGGLIGKAVLKKELTCRANQLSAPIIGSGYVGGFFGHMTSNGNLKLDTNGSFASSIEQVKGSTALVKGNTCIGGMFGYLEGNISAKGSNDLNIPVTARKEKAGGVAGYLKNCQLNINMFQLINTMSVTSLKSAGGIAGYAEGCTFTGSVKSYDPKEGIPAKSSFSSDFSGIVQGDPKSDVGENMGGIAGYAKNSSFENICCTGTVKGTSRIGGIVGYLDNRGGGTMKYCISNMSKGIKGAGNEVGGIAGLIETSNAFYTHFINYTTVTGKNHTGGVIGHIMPLGKNNAFTLEYGINTANVTGTINVGGVIAYLNHDGGNFSGKAMQVKYCANYGDITNSGEGNIGGIMGHGNRKQMYVMWCANHGTIYAEGPSKVGGIIGRIGHNSSTFLVSENMEMAYCCNRGTIKTDNKKSHIGGLAGYQEEGYKSDAFHWRTHDCYNAGKVASQTNSDTGGVLGCIDHFGHISRCINIGEVPYGNGVLGTHHGTEYSTGELYTLKNKAKKSWKCTVFSDSDKRNPSKFTNFDFDNIWVIAKDNNTNGGYPYLKNCPFQFIVYTGK